MQFKSEVQLIRDRDVARLLSMSCSWVRKQRMLRRGDEPHVLAIDPVLIGSTPRYRVSDVEAWLASQPNRVR